MPRRVYRSADEDSDRWSALELRGDDVIGCTRTKHGTTWLQAVLLHLVHGPGPLPAPLPVLSPWVDHLLDPLDAVVARLDAQPHRRVLKTHTPLDGLPRPPGVQVVVGARHPLDAAVSLYHHIRNLDRARMAELAGEPVPRGRPVVEPTTWVARWVVDDPDPEVVLDSLPGVMRHYRQAWAERDAPDVELVHFADLQRDRAAVVRRLADRLGIAGPGGADPDVDVDGIVAATSYAAMLRRAEDLVPDPVGIIADPRRFFRAGRSGDGLRLERRIVEAYLRRAADLLPPDLFDWLHR
jgi:aryl sulfotransferase